MMQAIVASCKPWALAFGVAAVLFLVLARLLSGPFCPRRLLTLHSDVDGTAQSLSFVLTLPIFVLILLFIVQVSQLMIATVVVHYAAYAAARSAAVWIPAYVNELEPENCIGWYYPDPSAEQVFPILDSESPDYGPTEGGVTYLVMPGFSTTGFRLDEIQSPKYRKIASAAVLACMPIAPSRFTVPPTPAAERLAFAAQQLYASLAPRSGNNAAVSRRILNKLAYSVLATEVRIKFFHPNSEPPLVTYMEPPDEEEFRPNELGWQDPVTVTVIHHFALLPGPGRILSRPIQTVNGQQDEVSQRIERLGNVYSVPIQASATFTIEGQKPVFRFMQPIELP